MSDRTAPDPIREALDSALSEFDNVRWNDVWEGLAMAQRPDLADWTRSYVGYVRADIEKARAALSDSTPSAPTLDAATIALMPEMWPEEDIEVRRVLAPDGRMLIVVGPFSGPLARLHETPQP